MSAAVEMEVSVPPVAQSLRDVQTLDELHALLASLSTDRLNRWTRTQILYYLTEEFREIAESYFDGERLKPAAEHPPRPMPIDVLELDAVLARIALVRPRAEGLAEPAVARPTIRSARELLTEDEAHESAIDVGERSEAIEGMLGALLEEIRAVDRKAPKRYRLKNGRCTGSADGRFIYQFTWSSEPDMFVPGTLEIGQERLDARVGAQCPDADRCYDLSVVQYLGPSIDSAVFRIDPTFLLRAVRERIDAKDQESDEPAELAKRLLSAPHETCAEGDRPAATMELNAQQRRAIGVASSVDRSYVWGPPGTGKTTTLGALVSSLVAGGKRVLVLSPYNVAVDEAILAVVKRGVVGTERIVRFGRVNPDVRAAGVDLDSHLERVARAQGTLDLARQLLAIAQGAVEGSRSTPPATVRACLDNLGALLVASKAARGDDRAKRISDALETLRKAFRAPERSIVSDAIVLGTTLALSVVSSLVYERRFDHLLIDEASVLRSPEALVACLMAGCPVTFFGDPKQLPAIVQERSPQTVQWLARNPFEMAGIGAPSDARGSCVMLEEQHRMGPSIRALVSGLFYQNRLTDGERAPKASRILVVDTSNTAARATTRMVRLSHSKENLIHRHIVAEVVRAVRRAEPDASVLVLAPFVAQKRAFKREPNSARLADIRFETIHTSQGSEREVVILDLVLTGGLRGGRSRMLDDASNPHLANLLNVATSRAKRYLVVVGHCEFLGREYRGGLVDTLLRQATALGHTVTMPRDLKCAAVLDAALRA